ncbi:MAG: glutamate racemase [Polyangiaceae bacterium]
MAADSARGDAPIGVFDSGLGGLTVVRALLRQLPAERFVYLGDTARVPYGTRSAATVCRYAESCASVLTSHHMKALVVACGTVSAVALEPLRSALTVPVLGVVEPGAQAAVQAALKLASGSGGKVKIGVLGTEGTIRSRAYERAVASLSSDVELVTQAAPLFVPLAEEGWVSGEVPRLAALRYVEPLIRAGASVLVLACTHYPLLAPVIREVAEELAGRPVTIVDSAEASATALAALLEERGIAAQRPLTPRLKLLATDLPASFHTSACRFLGAEAPEVTQVDITDTESHRPSVF